MGRSAMPLVQVNVKGTAIVDRTRSLRAVGRAADALPRGGTVILMAHGYKFSPFIAAASPHSHILSLAPTRHCYKAKSWPAHLGVTDGAGLAAPDEPLCIAVGWEARTTPWRAYANAAHAGAALTELVGMIRTTRPDLRITALAHSMGARVMLSLMSYLPARALSHAVLLAPAEMGKVACRFLDTPCGRTARVLCVTSGENALFEHLLSWAVLPHRLGDRALGHRLAAPHPHWTHLRIDDETTRAVLACMGYPLEGPSRRVCHWSVYLRDGVFPIYRDVLTGKLPLARLKAALPLAPQAGWQGLLDDAASLPLPMGGKAPS